MDEMQQFDSGATRNTSADKLDYEGFLSPAVLERYAQYMHQHRKQRDGQLRASDNWQKGIPLDAYAKSLVRHVMEFWKVHRVWPENEFRGKVLIDTADGPISFEDCLCAIIFNSMGYLFEILEKR